MLNYQRVPCWFHWVFLKKNDTPITTLVTPKNIPLLLLHLTCHTTCWSILLAPTPTHFFLSSIPLCAPADPLCFLLDWIAASFLFFLPIFEYQILQFLVWIQFLLIEYVGVFFYHVRWRSSQVLVLSQHGCSGFQMSFVWVRFLLLVFVCSPEICFFKMVCSFKSKLLVANHCIFLFSLLNPSVCFSNVCHMLPLFYDAWRYFPITLPCFTILALLIPMKLRPIFALFQVGRYIHAGCCLWGRGLVGSLDLENHGKDHGKVMGK